ncbi:hypothetical protein V5O48_012699 [Marasmius crinis-equi]|uniref:Uncharacterized protein n=1 Tax=Marasmius crinis-equi TaxID=585013 RepID=A0ABR3F256_9AGAR
MVYKFVIHKLFLRVTLAKKVVRQTAFGSPTTASPGPYQTPRRASNWPQSFHEAYYPIAYLGHPPTPGPTPLPPQRPLSAQASFSSPPASSTRPTSSREGLNPSEKLDIVLETIRSLNWTLGDRLHHLFRHKGKDEHRSALYYQMVSKFLGRLTKKGVSHVLEEIIHNPWGIPKLGNVDHNRMFTTEVDFLEVKAARPALTLFAAQLVEEEMEKEVKQAVKREMDCTLPEMLRGISSKEILMGLPR